MKRYLLMTLIILIFAGPSYAGVSSPLPALEKTPLPSVEPPNIRAINLPQGLTCYLLIDRELPIAEITFLIRAGGINDPFPKRGLAAMTAELVLQGGTTSLSPDEVERQLDALGARLTVDVSREMTVANFKILSSKLDEGLHLFLDMLFSPRFSPDRLLVVQKKFLESLKREEDDPETLADTRFVQLVYGKESPWGWRADRHSLKRITRADMVAFHQRHFIPANMIVAASGDVTRKHLVDALTSWISKVSVVDPHPLTLPKVDLQFREQEQWIERPLTQSAIRLGHLGIARHNPDKFAVMVMNDILGGLPFKSRLMEDIRTERGLAYGISSDFTPGRDAGLFVVRVSTKSQSTREVIDLVRSHLRRLVETGDVTPEELAFAKRAELNRFIFSFDRPSKAVTQQALFHFYGYPDDYWETYRQGIQAVTIDDIRRVARTYIHPEGLSLVVVGKRNGQDD
ncbi:MAG: insulinase family protein [Deltaproteobacteria bacterium]|nr:insulinase family protein [Deltaproteobacteria bacterium]